MHLILSKKYCYIFIIFFIFSVRDCIAYNPKIGDLLFQDLNCGTLCDAITDVTYGYKKTKISHVAMIVSTAKQVLVIEATAKNNVHVTSLQNFLKHSSIVLVGRLKTEFTSLIPKAVTLALSWQGLPYNKSFKTANKFRTFYCSQLIYDAFMLANNNKPIFAVHRMTFKKNNKFLPAWKNYFQKIRYTIPEGMIGTNPGILSRSYNIKIIYSYGQL